jgi:phage gp36-like protein
MAQPYSTTEQLRIKLKDNTKREFEEEVISSAITDADNYIDSYLANYYDISQFSSSVGIINSISKTLACAFVTGTQFGDFDQSSSTWESKMWNAGKNMLQQIQDGTMIIPGLTRQGV